MKIHPLGPDYVVVRCPTIDLPYAIGFTVYDSGPVGPLLRPLRMRCLVSLHLVASAAVYAGYSLEDAAREEAMRVCVPQLEASHR